jgi:hypothetical protein
LKLVSKIRVGTFVFMGCAREARPDERAPRRAFDSIPSSIRRNTMKTTTSIRTILLALPLLAATAPVFAENGVGGNSTTTNVTINSINWTAVAPSTVVPFMYHSYCTVTASADATNPLMADDEQYLFKVAVDGLPAGVDTVYERTVDFDNIAADDETDKVEVSSTGLFEVYPGVHTFQWLARKAAAADANMTVTDASYTFVCKEDVLGNSVAVLVD